MDDAGQLPDGYTCSRFLGVSKPDLLHRITELRFEIWAAGLAQMRQLFPDGVWRDEVDEASTHWAVFDRDLDLVATTRLTMCPGLRDLPHSAWYTDPEFQPPGPIAYFSRKVVAKSHRRKGLSRCLFHRQMRAAKRLEARTVVLKVGGGRSEWFLNRGFEVLHGPKSGAILSDLKLIAFAKAVGGERRDRAVPRK